MTADDGDVLLDVDDTYSKTSFIDAGELPNGAGLASGKTYYYSIFVRRTSDGKWFKAGVTLGVSVKDYGTATLMYEYMPFIYKTLNITAITDAVDEFNNDLYNFLKVFAFEHDMLKTHAENVKNKYNINNLDGRLIPNMLDQFGFTYERELGIQQGRRMLQNAANIHRKKGSVAGIKTFVPAFTGYSCKLDAVTNLMLNVDDSSFELGIGSWTSTSNGTLSSITGLSESPVVSPYQESTSPSNYPNAQAGMLKVVPTSSADVTIYCGSLSDTVKARTQSIPVTAGTAYAFTIFARAKTTAKNIKTGIKWVKSDGTFSSTTVTEVTSTNEATDAWNRTTVVTATAPSDAVWAIPYATIVSAASGEPHYFDAAQFEEGSSATDFVDARRIDIYLGPNRINEILNPSFESATTNWIITGGTGSVVASAPTGVGGSNSLKIVSSGTQPAIESDFMMDATALDAHTFSAYVKGPVTDTVALKIEWYDDTDTVIDTDDDTSENFTLTTAWGRVSYTATAPADTVKAKVKLLYTSANTREVFADALLFERTSYLHPYFDGDSGYEELTDLLWESHGATANDEVGGRSLYYRNRVVTYKRLKAVMEDYVPNYAPWATFIGYII